MITPASESPAPVFVSYSHRDARWLKRLQVHLKLLERAGLLSLWDDTRLTPGSKWREEIRNAISAARVAVLLVSADYLASDFIATDELPPLLQSAKQRGVRILPLVVSSSLFERVPSLSQFQAVNAPSAPLNKMPKAKQEAVLLELARTIQDILVLPLPEGATSTNNVLSAPPENPARTQPPASATGSGALLERIAACTGVELVSMIVREEVTLEEFDRALAEKPATATAALRTLVDRLEGDFDTWLRMLCAHMCSRVPALAESATDVAFDSARSWGVRTTAISWLRYCPRKQRSVVANQIYERRHGNDLDRVRLAVAGAGYLGAPSELAGILEKFDALSSTYYNQKLGPYGSAAYLDCFVLHGREWQPFNLLDEMSKVYDATEEAGHMHRTPLDFVNRLQTISSGSAIVLLDHLWKSPHGALIQALLWLLARAPRPMLASRLVRLIARAGPDDFPYDALSTLARIQSPETVQVVSDYLERGQLRHDKALSLAIGTNRSVRHLANVVAARDEVDEAGDVAYWALGELARDRDPTAITMLRKAAIENDSGMKRAHAWVGLAKAGENISSRDLEDAVQATTKYNETVVLGIAGSLLGHHEVLEHAVHASQLNGAPLWRLQGHLYSDYLAALTEGSGAAGQFLLALLRCGDLMA